MSLLELPIKRRKKRRCCAKIKKKENVRSAPCPNANGNGSKRMSETLHRLQNKAEARTLIKRTSVRVGRFEK